jgi:hypothetical protein
MPSIHPRYQRFDGLLDSDRAGLALFVLHRSPQAVLRFAASLFICR